MHKITRLTILVLLVALTYARVLNFSEKFRTTSGKAWSYEFQIGLFSRNDINPFLSPLATGDTFAQFNLTGTKGLELLFIPGTEFRKHIDEDGKYKCQGDKLGIDGKDPTIVHRPLDTLPTIEQRLITTTDIYHLFIARCATEEADITIEGSVTLMNPYGHLEGQFFGTWIFYALLSVAYVVVCFFWIILSCIYRKDFLTLQFCTTLVLGLCTLESVVIYFDYFTGNVSGVRSVFLITSGVILTVIRKIVSRILVLIVCMGYGSVKPSLERKTWYTIGLIGVLYFIASTLFEIVQVLRDTEEISEFWFLVFNIPVDILDMTLYVWIVHSLWYTLNELKFNKQTAKLYLYNRLFQMLLTYAILSIILLVGEAMYNVSKVHYKFWPYHWLFQAGNQTLFFFAFLTIIILWRPSRHNKRYLYSEQLTTSDEFMNASDDDQMDIEMMLQEDDSDEEEDTRGRNRLRHVDHSLPTPATPAQPSLK